MRRDRLKFTQSVSIAIYRRFYKTGYFPNPLSSTDGDRHQKKVLFVFYFLTVQGGHLHCFSKTFYSNYILYCYIELQCTMNTYVSQCVICHDVTSLTVSSLRHRSLSRSYVMTNPVVIKHDILEVSKCHSVIQLWNSPETAAGIMISSMLQYDLTSSPTPSRFTETWHM